jgi:hypothetical protein
MPADGRRDLIRRLKVKTLLGSQVWRIAGAGAEVSH